MEGFIIEKHDHVRNERAKQRLPCQRDRADY